MATQTMTDDKNNPNALAADDGVSIFKYALIGSVVVILGVIGYNVVQGNKESSLSDLGNKIYQYQEAYLNPALENKQGETDLSTVTAEFSKLFNHDASKQGALTVESIRLADLLMQNKKRR